MRSKFKDDLSKEVLLGKFLDKFYFQKYNDTSKSFQRITSLEEQMQGVDLIITIGGKAYIIDEKAQLDYLNKSLPTFAFEISFLKNKKVKTGWFFDHQKKTNIYFLVTNIQTRENENSTLEFTDYSITAVHRINLQKLLSEKGLDEKKILEYTSNIRKSQQHGKHPIPELNSKQEGFFYFSFENKNEKPINLVLYLKFLKQNNQIGKKIR